MRESVEVCHDMEICGNCGCRVDLEIYCRKGPKATQQLHKKEKQKHKVIQKWVKKYDLNVL